MPIVVLGFLVGVLPWVSDPLERRDRVWSVAVFSEQQSSQWLDHAAHTLAQSLEKAGRAVVDPKVAMNFASGTAPTALYPVPEALLSRIDEVAKLAENYLSAGDDQKAMDVLSLPYPGYSIEYFLPSMKERYVSRVVDVCLYGVRAYLHMAQSANGHRAQALQAQAAEYMRMCYSQVPNFNPSVKNHSDRVLRIAQEIGQDILHASPHELTLHAPYAGARCGFAINGRWMAKAPTATIRLALGNYLVQLKCGRKLGMASAITARGKATYVLVPSLPEIPKGGGSGTLRYIAASSVSKLSLQSLAAIVTAMRLKELVTLQEQGETLMLYRYALQGTAVNPVAAVRVKSRDLSAQMDAIVHVLIQGRTADFSGANEASVPLPKHPKRSR